jgi:hypothetical protein
MVVQYVSFGLNLAITAAGAPTGVGAVMAGVGTSLAAGKVPIERCIWPCLVISFLVLHFPVTGRVSACAKRSAALID